MINSLKDLVAVDEQEKEQNFLLDFNRAITYDDYVKELGNYLSLHQMHYKKFASDNDIINQTKMCQPLKILVLTEAWCADSLALLPIVRRIAEVNGHWELRILYRDDNRELMDQFLTDGVRAIPVFLFLDEDGKFLFRWGPRPIATKKIFEANRPLLRQGKIEKQEIIKKIRTFYARDRGRTTFAELMHLFKAQGIC